MILIIKKCKNLLKSIKKGKVIKLYLFVLVILNILNGKTFATTAAPTSIRVIKEKSFSV